MLYLWTLHRKEYSAWFADRDRVDKAMKELEKGYSQHFGRVKYLGGQIVEGSFPGDPDAFVVATCLMVCKKNGIDFVSSRDVISYSVDMLDGSEVGVCRIRVNSPQASIPHTQIPRGKTNRLQEVLVVWGMGAGIGCGVLCLLGAGIMAIGLNTPNSGVQKGDVVSYGVVGIVLLGIGLTCLRYYLRVRRKNAAAAASLGSVRLSGNTTSVSSASSLNEVAVQNNIVSEARSKEESTDLESRRRPERISFSSADLENAEAGIKKQLNTRRLEKQFRWVVFYLFIFCTLLIVVLSGPIKPINVAFILVAGVMVVHSIIVYVKLKHL